jgi:hypothetical protein
MRRAKSELIVPIRDRRQHRRILTLRNFWKAMLVMIVIFAGITIEANLRKSKTSEYGRLYGKRVEQTPAVARKPDIVQEGQINDANAADPTLVVAQARAQILTGEADNPLTSTATPPAPAPGAMIGHDNAGRLVVVGGPEGVKLVQQNNAKPVLGGGFGRQ